MLIKGKKMFSYYSEKLFCKIKSVVFYFAKVPNCRYINDL